jgi:hypothetical protein
VPARVRLRFPFAGWLAFRGALTVRELCWAAGLIACATAVPLLSHVLHGGFYLDDWLVVRPFGGGHGYAAIVSSARPVVDQPLLPYLLALPDWAFGDHASGFLAITVVLSALSALSLFVLLRVLSLERGPSLLISLLFVLLPAADSVRLWSTAGWNNLAVACFFFGLAATLKAVRVGCQAIWGVAGLALYAVSVLTYDVAAPAVLVSIVVLWRRGETRKALSWWAIDSAAVAGAIVYLRSRSFHPTLPVTAMPAHARQIARQAITIFRHSLLPWNLSAAVVAALLIGIGVLAALRWRLLPRSDRLAVRRWMLISVAGVFAVGVGYLAIIPAWSSYLPLNPGTGNRINILSAAGYAIAVYGVVSVLSYLVLLPRGATRLLSPAIVSAGLGFSLAVAYGAQLHQDARGWDTAAALQRWEVASIIDDFGAPPHGMTVYVFGAPIEYAPNVPVFDLSSGPGDLRIALELTWHDPTVLLDPVHPGTRWQCDPRGLVPYDPSVPPRLPPGIHGKDAIWFQSPYGPKFSAVYGKAEFLDLRTGAVQLIAGRQDCVRYRERFQPGPDPVTPAL